ncbi:MAG: hypothetical protein FWF15_06530 [Oscillospiraceae bacterium]|nr:hypothetical protein [Oscillospiraceae bacterium]
MKFSLLYKIPETPNLCDVVYDLSVDKAVRLIYTDARRADYFLSVLMKPLLTTENVYYRQEILKDFLNIPKLFSDVKLIFNRYDKMKNDWRELRSGVYPTASGVNQRALRERTYESLKTTAIFPKSIISFYRSILDILSKYEIQSEGLTNFKQYCSEMIENNSLNEIAKIAALFQYHSPDMYNFSVRINLDETLKLCVCDLCGITDFETESANPFRKFFGKKKTETDYFTDVGEDETADTAGETIDDTLFILNEALHHIDAALTQITNDVYEIFYGFSTELQFYEAALHFTNWFKNNNLQFSFPKVLPMEDDIFRAENLYDMLLAAEGKKSGGIVENDALLGSNENGILIKGANKTGKTSYLRAIGLAQLFAQAGLPVCAPDSEISIRSVVFTHFSAAEEDFKMGDTAGRFEGEVQLVAKIVDNLQRYSLILLNETFQTTSYSEGTEGIYHILSALPMAGSKFVFVTRLNGLFEMMKEQDVKYLETGYKDDLYKISTIKL